MTKLLLGCLLLIWAAGCATPPIATPVSEMAPHSLSAHDLAESVWTAAPRVMRIHQTAHLKMRGREFQMIGLMELDTRNNEARLVGLNEFGVKLFDLEVTENDVTEHYLLPQISRFPQLSEAVGVSLRRIFLIPAMEPDRDGLSYSAGGYLLTGDRGDQKVLFQFGGDPVRLIEKNVNQGPVQWRVVFFDYQNSPQGDYPGRILLVDRQAGYRLELNIESVRIKDEQIED